MRIASDTLIDHGRRTPPRQRRPWPMRLLPLAGLLLLLAVAVRPGESHVGPALVPVPQLSIGKEINRMLSAVDGPRRLMLVADVSASMSDPPPGRVTSQSKWDLVRRGVAEFLRTLPVDAVVGVRVFGQSAARCAASEQLRPPLTLGDDGAREITAALDRLHPAGDTPLAGAIKAAADDLGDAGGEIVVLSDGMETCAGAEEVCATARSVAMRGEELRIDVVQTFMDEDAQRAIACVPEATGGVGVNFVHGDASVLTALLLRMLPLRLVTAILLIAFGGLTFFWLCDLLAGALGTFLVRGTAGFIADITFAMLSSLWAAFWLTRLTRFPFALAVLVAIALIAFLYREIPRRRSAAQGVILV